jgi:hypothetical protein
MGFMETRVSTLEQHPYIQNPLFGNRIAEIPICKPRGKFNPMA